jgi:hypothetical protein
MRTFIRTALLVAASMICPFLSLAQPPPPIPGAGVLLTNGLGPRIQFDNENYDAGTNMTGDKIYHTFLVTNTGDQTLVLTAVKPSCGCTTVGGTIPGGTSGGSGQTTTWTHEIAPGGVGIIPIQVATDNMHGPLHKTVTVTSNDRARLNVVLNISGTAWLPIEVSPPQVSFAVMPDATNRSTQVVRIYNRTETPLSVWDPSCTTNAFGLLLKTNVPGQEFELTVTAPDASQMRGGLSSSTMQGEIYLKTSVSNRNPLIITAFETVFPEITIFPNVLQIPAGPLTQPATSHLTVRDNIADLRVSDPTVNVPGASVSVTVVQTNRQYYLTVTFPQGYQAETNQHLGLTVKTDNPRFPTITIPVTPIPNVQLPVLRGGAVPARAMVPPPGVAGGLTPVTNNAAAPMIKANSP